MNDLLQLAIDAHGGLERWNQFQHLDIDVSIDGGIWYVKQQPRLLIDKRVSMRTHEEHLTVTPFGGDGLHSVFTPKRLTIENANGDAVQERDDPEAAFRGQTLETAWDALHVVYFSGEALWTYFTMPFLYTTPGFAVEEIAPWHEGGETWRSLQVTFPEHVATHHRRQITRFGDDGLIRRHDYTVDILGGATGAKYTSGYRDFQGIRLPTVHRVFAYDDAMQKVPEPLLVSIDVSNATFR